MIVQEAMEMMLPGGDGTGRWIMTERDTAEIASARIHQCCLKCGGHSSADEARGHLTQWQKKGTGK